jgi:dihydropteroate synthase type 2
MGPGTHENHMHDLALLRARPHLEAAGRACHPAKRAQKAPEVAVTRYLAPPLVPAGRPRIIGIVNITEDSFSDGGRYLPPADALEHAYRLRAEGADIIELGPAASHPGAAQVTPAEQQRRLEPVMDALSVEDIPVSVDSFVPDVQRFAIAQGAAYLNDTQGFSDPALHPELASAGCRLVVMHSVQRTGPATVIPTDPALTWAGIEEFFAGRLAALQDAGVGRERMIIDPGLGYFLGSNPEPSLIALAGIRHLKTRFGLPVLVSPSRKSFLRAVTGRGTADTGPASLAAELYAAWQGADYIRTHDVAALRDALAVLDAITRQDYSAPGHRAHQPPPLST